MRTAAVKQLCEVITRGSAPTYSGVDVGDALVIGQSCQRPDHSFDESRARWHAGPVPTKGRVFGGEVLINSTGTGTLGRVALLPELDGRVAFVDSHVTMLRIDPVKADARFVAYQLGLRSFGSLAEVALSVGATKQRELNVDALRSHRIYVDDVGEQKRVADFLDRECTAIAALEEETAEYERRLPAPALETFRRLTDGMPRGRVGYGFDVQLGKMLDEKRVDPENLSPYLRNANVHWDRLALDDLKLMTFDPAERHKFSLQHGDLLVCEGGEPGRAAVWNGEVDHCYFQKALHRVRPYADSSVRFLLWGLRDLSARDAFKGDGPGRYTHLTAEQLRAVRIPMPSAEIQRRVAAEVDAQARVGRAIAHEIEGLASALREYRDALITEAVTGKLDVSAVSERQIDESAQAAMEGARPEVLSA